MIEKMEDCSVLRTGSLCFYGFEGIPRELVLRLLKANREQFTGLFGEVMIHPENLPIPEGSYIESRQQYRARPFLRVLGDIVHHPNHALGLVDLDLFVPELNFIFGSAQFGGNAIVALPRLRQSFYSLPDDDDLFFQRTVKEVFHELGHVMGLHHCTNHCVMQFSNSLIDTDNKPANYCPACFLQLQ